MKKQLTLAQEIRANKKEDYEAKKADLIRQGLWQPGSKKFDTKKQLIKVDIEDTKKDSLGHIELAVDKSDTKDNLLHFDSNRFKQIVQKVPHYVYLSNCQSYFTDEEAIRLCSNMTCSVPRRAVQELRKSKFDTLSYKKYRYELHYLANKALSIYGANVLAFVYNLNQLDFADFTSAKLKQVVSSKSFDYATVDFPTLTFTTADFYEYSLIFSYDDALSNYELRRTPQVKIYSRTYGAKIGYIDKAGSVVSTLERASVKLDLFLSAIKNGQGFELRLGVANGNCIICGTELKNSASKRRGIGPDCLRQL